MSSIEVKVRRDGKRVREQSVLVVGRVLAQSRSLLWKGISVFSNLTASQKKLWWSLVGIGRMPWYLLPHGREVERLLWGVGHNAGSRANAPLVVECVKCVYRHYQIKLGGLFLCHCCKSVG